MKKEEKLKLKALLSECDRMDLWRYVLNHPDKKGNEPEDFIELLIQEHPIKKERVVNKIDENYAF